MEFQRDWKRYCLTIEDKAKYLTTKISSKSGETKYLLSPDDAKVLFRSEIDCSIMGDIIESLQHLAVSTQNNKIEVHQSANSLKSDEDSIQIVFVYEWLYTMTQCERFSLNVLFLSDTQKN